MLVRITSFLAGLEFITQRYVYLFRVLDSISLFVDGQ